jgi:hypothetical protein
MAKKIPSRDPNVAAHSVLEEIMNRDEARSTAPMQKNKAAMSLGRLGGLKGGPARAAALSPERRSEIARKAAAAREARRKKG